jgi:CubicO group peptidase (beta-lactamase class C family)
MSRLLPAIVLLGFMILPGSPALSQSIYFPPDNNADWERVAPESLGWDTARLDEFLQWLGESETMAFVILKDGKLVVEQYYGLFNRDREWYWASAGKTVTAVLIGALQQQGLMDIHQPTSRYLGAGWTSLTPEQEQRITPWHQLTMTTGVDYGVADKDCTLPQCLRYRANAGEQWFYHNAPYTLLTHVAEAAADTNINTLLNKAFESVPGIKLRYINGLGSPYNRVVASRALDMARFGLLVSNRMAWGEGAPLVDSTFADAMLQPSQDLNPAYGYLWWLNGQDSFIPPGFSISVQQQLIPEAPPDMVSALGANSQILSIVPSLGLVIVRMGQDPGTLFSFANQKWSRLAQVLGTSTSAIPPAEMPVTTHLDPNYPNPFNPTTVISYHLASATHVRLDVFDLMGRGIATLVDAHQPEGTHRLLFQAEGLSSGVYLYRLQTPDAIITRTMMLIR